MSLNNMGLGFQLTADDTASAVFDKAGGSLGKLEEGAKKTQEQMQEVGEELESMGHKLMAIGAAGLVGLGAASYEAGQFESQMARVSTVVDEAKFSTDDLRKLTEKLSETYGGSTADEAKALYAAIQSGADTAEKAQKLLSLANKLTADTGLDLTASTEALSSATHAFAAQGLDAAHAADVFMAAVKGGIPIEQLTEQLKRLGPTAAAAGVSFDQLTEMLIALHKAGITDERGAIALKQVIEDLARPTAAASAEAAKLGVTLNAASVQAKGLPEILRELGASGHLTTAALKQLFGDGAELTLVMQLMAQQGIHLQEGMDAVNNSTGSLDDAWAKMKDTFDHVAAVLKAKLATALVRIGDVLLPMLSKAADLLSDLIDYWNELPSGVQKAVVWFIAAASAGALLFGAILTIVGAVMAAAGSLEVVAIALAAAAGIFEALVVVVGLAATAFFAFKDAYEKNLGGFADFVNSVWTKVKLAVEAVQQLFSDGGFSGDVQKDLNKAGNEGIKDFAITVFLWFNRIKNFFGSLVDAFHATVATFGPVFDELRTAFSELLAAFGFAKDAPDQAKSKFEAFGAAGATVGEIIAKVAKFMVEGLTTVIHLVTGLVQGFKAAGPVISSIAAAFGQVWDALKAVFSAFSDATGAGNSNTSMWQTLGQVIGFVAGAIGRSLAMMISLFAAVLREAAAVIDGIVGYFTGLVDQFRGLINIFKGLVHGDWGQVWTGMKQVVYGVVESIVSVVSAMIEGIAAQFDSIASMVGKDLGLANAVRKAKNDMLAGLKDKMGLNEPTPAPAPTGAPPATTTPGGPPPPGGAPGGPPAGGVPPLAPATNPAMALVPAALQQTAAAAPSQAPQPINLNSTVQLMMDGQLVSTIVQKVQDAEKAQSMGPTPTAQ